jgi:O-antigen ligase
MSFFDSEDSSFAWRSSLWRGVWSELAVNPLFGLGLGQRIYLDMGSYKDYVELRNIHNSFLAITTQLGLVGIILLATLVLNLFIRVWRISLSDHYLQMKKLILLGVLVFCSVAFLFQPYLEANWFSIWWWLALGLSRSLYENSTS